MVVEVVVWWLFFCGGVEGSVVGTWWYYFIYGMVVRWFWLWWFLRCICSTIIIYGGIMVVVEV